MVAIMAVLTGGWPLVGSVIHNQRPLAAGTQLTIGSGSGNSAHFTVGSGWSTLQASSNPRVMYALSRGPVLLSVRFVSLASAGLVAQLWAGLHTTVRLSNPGVALSKPRGATTMAGNRGLTGVLSGRGMVGTATSIPGPSRRFAIQVIVLGPRGNRAVSREAAMQLVRSITFPAAP